ncbi:MAG: hypothetical protein ABI583_05840 [Betaproteobacteria bacterium]
MGNPLVQERRGVTTDRRKTRREGGTFNSEITMRREARKTLTNLHTIQRLRNYVICARAELAGDPSNALLGEFIRVNERLIVEEEGKSIEEA